jgi:hypothetical protein
VASTGPYILTIDASCSGGESLNPSIRWLDSQDRQLSLSWELVVPGRAPTEQFIRAVAPKGASQALVGLDPWGEATCSIREVSLQGPEADQA